MKRILIIDDEPYITEIIKLFTDKLGYETDIINSGYAVLEKLNTNDYWSVFCDLKMPGMNGMELFDQIGEMRSELRKRFVLLTGSILDEKIENALKEKRIFFLRKPFTFEDFRKIFTTLENVVL